MGGLTLDAGAIVALERTRRDIGKVVEAAVQTGVRITVPANAIAEWWRGRTDRRDYVRKIFVIKEVDEQIAKLAGEARASWKRERSRLNDGVTIDATVIATAALYGANLYTRDFEDMQRFQRFFPTVRLFGLNTR